MLVVKTPELSDHNAIRIDVDKDRTRQINVEKLYVKDLDRIKYNGRKVLISLLKRNFNPQ